MQIIPTSKQETVSDHLFAALGHTSEEGSSFADELMRYRDAQKSVDKGDAFSVKSALAESSPFPSSSGADALAQAPYSRHTSNGVTYSSVEEVCFTKQELHELRQNLENAGAPPETLTGLDKLAQQPDGATLSQVVASLHPAQEAPKLSESDTNSIKSVCDRIDSTGKLGKNVLDLMQQGQGKQALDMLLQGIQGMPAGERLVLEKGEMAALGKGLGLSQAAQKQLTGSFGPYNSLSLNGADFNRLMGPATNDIMQRDLRQQKLDQALGATLQPVLSKAKARMELEQASTEKSNRRTDQSKTLIQKTVLSNVNATLEGTAAQAQQGVAAQADLNARNALQNSGQNANQTAGKGKEDSKDQIKTGPHDVPMQPQNNANALTARNAAQQTNGQNQQGQTGKDNQNNLSGKGKDDAAAQALGKDTGKKGQEGTNIWGGLLDKMEVRTSTATTATATTAPLVGATAAGSALNGVATALDNMTTQNAATRPTLPRQAATQIEQAMLSAMRDGSKRLELQLHPGELGNLTLMLTTRNGEVSATIRSEKGETADMINRQLDVLRTQLEQQGVKVDKLEVQTQLADNNNRQQWEGMQQHNARQEENARRDNLDRLRNLGKMRNNDEFSGNAILEQGVQLVRQSAGNAAQSIYIVA